jgi:hypothetical protein
LWYQREDVPKTGPYLPINHIGQPFKTRKTFEDGKGMIVDFIRLELSNLVDKGFREMFITEASNST